MNTIHNAQRKENKTIYYYIIRRLLLIIPTFLGITFFCFTITRFVPGGPVEQAILYDQQIQEESESGGVSSTIEARDVSEEMISELKIIYGFDKPFYIAYIQWIWKVIHFDLGISDTYGRPVWGLIKEKFPISIWFGLAGFFLSYAICIPLGVWKAVKHGSIFDITSSVIIFVAYSVPGWIAGIVLLMLFAGGSFWNIFPLGESHSSLIEPNTYLSSYLLQGAKIEDIPESVLAQYPEIMHETTINSTHPAFPAVPKDRIFKLIAGSNQDLNAIGWFLDRLKHMILPIFCYVLSMFASMTVLIKNSLIENLSKDYVRTAFSKGLSEHVVIFKHVLKNSLIPIAIGFGHALSIVLAGSYLIEKVFNINGFGLLGYQSLIARDYPVTLGIMVVASLLKLLGNIISDMLYLIIDPRIKFT